jgi:hypothetical protein
MLHYYRSKNWGSNNSVNDAENILRPIVFQNADDLDSVFVYGYFTDDLGQLILGDGSHRSPCYAAFSTRRMIQTIETAVNSRLPIVLHIDATY